MTAENTCELGKTFAGPSCRYTHEIQRFKNPGPEMFGRCIPVGMKNQKNAAAVLAINTLRKNSVANGEYTSNKKLAITNGKSARYGITNTGIIGMRPSSFELQ